MPKHAVVTLRYGPYSAVGLSVEHRTYRLEGLQAVLAKDGHEIILEQIEDWNLVELVVNEEIVFQCDIQDLEFVLPFKPMSRDPVNLSLREQSQDHFSSVTER
ncbi:UPF0728 protein C10orf53 homolog [Alexandromys fortis]|uniref:UPF0728 protein C10orf53 homolog n=1 Tax=Alexandromys fortis TaxID=100897 RepID=UPI0021521EF2|nr:UPF0728 protein C10orf53 homolog [Microtus fortis]